MEVNIKALKAQIEAIRGQISTTSELAAGYADPHPPSAIVKARVEAEIEGIRTAALDRTVLSFAGASEANWHPGRLGQSLAKLSAVELLALVDPVKLAKALIESGEQEAAQSDPAFRLSEGEARAAIAAKEAEMLRLEVQEESLIRLAEGEGIMVQRRRAADPSVALALDAELEAFLAIRPAA
jgi:hypothetical protein